MRSKPTVPASPRVALLIESSNAYGRGLLAGVADYIQQHGPWSVYLPELGRGDTARDRLRGWRGDGALVRAEDKLSASAVASFGSAVVDLSTAGLLPRAPVVHSDVRLEAELGFEHLWERGFRQLGFCGVSDYSWVDWQRERFTALADARGIRVNTLITPLRNTRSTDTPAGRKALVNWLRKLPKPIGIFACYDLRGQQVLDACRSLGLRIPDELAVIGVDDDTVRCNLSDPPLSSVAPDTRRIGFRAAELLAQLMAGHKVEPGLRLVPPLGVTARRSTDALAIADPDVAAAVRFIRDRCCEPINVDDVLAHVPMSRRSLENRFVESVGRTPHAQIVRSRMERACQLLMDTDLSIKAVAAKVGFRTPEYMTVAFQRTLNTTPSAFRRRV